MRAARGAAAIETALILPVALLLMFGLIDWSWLLFQWHTVESSSLRGVRVLSGDPDLAGLQERAEGQVNAYLADYGIDPDAATTTVEVEDQPYGHVVTVTVSVEVEPLIGLGFRARSIGATANAPYFGYLYAEQP